MDCTSKYVDCFNELERIIEAYRGVPFVEIEIRLGWKHPTKGFDANIGKRYLEWIREKLDKSSYVQCATENRNVVSNVYTHGHTRILTDDKHTVMDRHVKRKCETVDLYAPGTPFDMRVSVCTEKPVRGSPTPPIKQCCFVRKRMRTTYAYKMWRYDTTVCVADMPTNEFVMDKETFEFELELDVTAANREGVSSTYLAHSAMMKLGDILTMNEQEEIHLKSIDVCDRRRYTNNRQSKLQS